MDLTPTTWATQTDLGTFSTWGELVNAKWETLDSVTWDFGQITVTVALDIWDPIRSTILTGWDLDDLNP